MVKKLTASVFARGLDHPEGIAVGPDGAIWAGGEAGQIYVVASSGRPVTELTNTGGFNGGLAFDRNGDCYVCNVPGRLLRIDQVGRWDVVARSAAEEPIRVPNFPVFGPDGTLYISDSGSWDKADGMIFRFESSGRGEVFHRGPFHYTNGLAIDARGEFLYVVESARHCVVRLRIAEGGSAKPEMVCAPGSLRWNPDGLAFDADGVLYITTYGTSRIYELPLGGKPRILVEDRLGMTLNRPTNVAFAGQHLLVANLGGTHLSLIELGRWGQPLYGNKHTVLEGLVPSTAAAHGR